MLSIHCKIALFFYFFGLSAILKIRIGEHAHHVGLVVAYTWNREKQIFVALGKEFDMEHLFHCSSRSIALFHGSTLCARVCEVRSSDSLK